jgi:hypothetical protein
MKEKNLLNSFTFLTVHQKWILIKIDLIMCYIFKTLIKNLSYLDDTLKSLLKYHWRDLIELEPL